MKSLTKTMAMATIAASALALSVPAMAQNIVSNGDFSDPSVESGPVPGWVVAPNNEIAIGTGTIYQSCCNTAALGNQANRFVAFGGGNIPNISALSQVLSTVTGVSYVLTYSTTALSGGAGTQSFHARLLNGSAPNGTPLEFLSLTQIASSITTATAGSPFVTYTLGFTAQSNTTTLAFNVFPLVSGLDDNIDVILDDVSVSAAPEPATWGMMIVGFGIAGAALRVRRRRPAVTA